MDSLLLSSATQAAFVKVCPVILTQDLKGRQPIGFKYEFDLLSKIATR
jgi:hypothetical protein